MRFGKTKKPETDASRGAARKFVPTVVADGLNILGNIVSEGMIDFNGVIDGNIKCDTITVRAQGHVRGEIVAETALIYGNVRGMIKARNVQLFAGCQVEGLVMHEALSIEEGAVLDGKCKRTDRVYLNDNDTNTAADSSSSSTAAAAPMPMAPPSPTSSDTYGFEEMPVPDFKILENLRLIS